MVVVVAILETDDPDVELTILPKVLSTPPVTQAGGEGSLDTLKLMNGILGPPDGGGVRGVVITPLVPELPSPSC